MQNKIADLGSDDTLGMGSVESGQLKHGSTNRSMDQLIHPTKNLKIEIIFTFSYLH